MNDHDVMRERLLAAARQSNPMRESQLSQEIQNMLTKQLSKTRRVFLSLVSVGALAGSLLCGYLSLTEPKLPMLPRWGLAVGSLIGLCWVGVLGAILVKGRLDLKQDSRRIAQMVWCFTIAMMVFFLLAGMTATDPLKGLLLVAQGLAFLIMAGVYWINHRIEEAELTLREQLLRLELQLAERQQV